MIFEPILFGITGTQIKIKELGGSDVYLTLACLIIGVVVSHDCINVPIKIYCNVKLYV